VEKTFFVYGGTTARSATEGSRRLARRAGASL